MDIAESGLGGTPDEVQSTLRFSEDLLAEFGSDLRRDEQLADIFLDDVTVSRRHAEFLREGSEFTVRDLASLNGTYFDGQRIEQVVLTDGAEVQIGKFRLTFFASRSVAPQGS